MLKVLESIQISREGSVAENTYLALKNAVDKGYLKPGQQLPNEIELSQILGISRSSLRDAFKKLENMHYIVRSKRGTRITEDIHRASSVPFDVMLKESTIQDLLELRMMLEQEIVAKAAIKASGKEIAALQTTIDGMKNAIDNIPVLCRHDAAFHYGLAEISENKLWTSIFRALQNYLEALIMLAFERDNSIMYRAILFHERILDAIRSGDEKLARRAMKEHIENVKSVYAEEPVVDRELNVTRQLGNTDYR